MNFKRNVPKHVGFAQYNNTALIQSDGLVDGDGVDHAHGILRLGHQRRDAFFQVDDTMAGFDTGGTFQHYVIGLFFTANVGSAIQQVVQRYARRRNIFVNADEMRLVRIKANSEPCNNFTKYDYIQDWIAILDHAFTFIF